MPCLPAAWMYARASMSEAQLVLTVHAQARVWRAWEVVCSTRPVAARTCICVYVWRRRCGVLLLTDHVAPASKYY